MCAARRSRRVTKRDAEHLYDLILTHIVEPRVGSVVTYGSDLRRFGQHILGDAFSGVYSADQIPPLTAQAPYCIANLDPANMPGSHWVALARRPDGHIVYYDSYGRTYRNTLGAEVSHLPGKWSLTQTPTQSKQHTKQIAALVASRGCYCSTAGGRNTRS